MKTLLGWEIGLTKFSNALQKPVWKYPPKKRCLLKMDISSNLVAFSEYLNFTLFTKKIYRVTSPHVAHITNNHSMLFFIVFLSWRSHPFSPHSITRFLSRLRLIIHIRGCNYVISGIWSNFVCKLRRSTSKLILPKYICFYIF